METIVHGIDVASYQHPHDAPIDWRAAGELVDFAYVKATEGNTYNNPFFLADITAAQAAGIPRGGYHYGRPVESSPEVQAQHFRAVCGRLDLPPFGDAEGGWLAGVQANTDWWLRWLDAVGDPIRLLYLNGADAVTRVDSNRLAANGVDLFYAHPTDDSGNLWPTDDFRGVGAWPTATILQTAGWPVPGIVGNVDHDTMTATTFARLLAGGTPNQGDTDMTPDENAALSRIDTRTAEAATRGEEIKTHLDEIDGRLAAIESKIAAGGSSEAPEHLTGTVDIHTAP